MLSGGFLYIFFCIFFYISIDMRIVIVTLLVVILVHSTSGQSYPNCGGNCRRDGEYDMFSIIIT